MHRHPARLTLAAVALALGATCLHGRLAPTPGVVASGPPARATRLDDTSMRVRADHPRIWLDPSRVEWLRAKVRGQSGEAVAKAAGASAPGLALTSVATGDARWCRAAFESRTQAAAQEYHLALLYDWCHAQLSAEERATLRAVLVPQMDAEMKNGRSWRSLHNAGHTAALSLTLAALALAGDDPIAERALAFLRPELEDMLETFDRLFPDGEWAEGVDYARHASHHGLRTFSALKSATGVDLLAGSPHLRNIAQYIFYATKPNGLLFNGDDNDYPYVSGWEHMALLMIASEYRDPYAQWFLGHFEGRRFELVLRDRWADLLWRDETIPEAPLDDLPLSRIFRGKGLVLARTGWGMNDPAGTWLAFTNGDYFGDHDHYDVNAFQIYAGGDLAIDSGRYDDDWGFIGKPDQVARSQFFNYYQRTIAHNTMLVHDPYEIFPRGFLNDGGQRHLLLRDGKRNVPEDYAQGTFPSDDGVGTHDWTTNPGRWERGDITAYTGTKDFVFVRGDATRAYAPTKLSAFVRDLVFVRPRLVVVFDRVVATKASFEKTWLLHTIDEPRIATGGTNTWFEVTAGEGRLFGLPLLPHAPRLTKVGGPGNEFRVGEVRFGAGPRSVLNPSELHYGEQPGAWRIEERPSAASTEDYFANVLFLTQRASDDRPHVEVLADDEQALSFRVSESSGAVTSFRFAKGPKPATTLKIERGGAVTFDGVLPDHVVLEDGRR